MTLTKTKVTAIASVAGIAVGKAIKVWHDNVQDAPVPVVHKHYHKTVINNYYGDNNKTSIGPSSDSSGSLGEGSSNGYETILYSVCENDSIFCNLFIESRFVTIYVCIPITLLLLSCLTSYLFVHRYRSYFTNRYIIKLLELADMNRKIQVWLLLVILLFSIFFDIFCMIYWS